MKKIISILITLVTLSFSAMANEKESENTYSQNASITIRNKSDYTLTVKVMRCEGGLYSTVRIGPRGSSTVAFGASGDFYTKTKAEKSFETIYKMGDGFHVTCTSTQYTEGTLEFYVSSSVYGPSSHNISKAEFEKNY